MKKLWVMGVIAMGCGQSNDDCLDTYRSGADGDSYETTCSTPASSSGSSEAELRPGDCLETYTTVCPTGQECRELYERRCQEATANVPPTDIGQLSEALLLSDCSIDNEEHTVTALRPLFEPFITAINAINAEFDADDADISFFLRGIQSRGQQGSLDVRAIGILDFDPDNDRVTGVTNCIRDGGTGDRGRCEIIVFRDAIEAISEETGLDPVEVEYVTAMHEFGHTFCLDHMSVDSSAQITAMNSFHSVDTSRPQLDYLHFLGSERDQVRSIIRNP